MSRYGDNQPGEEASSPFVTTSESTQETRETSTTGAKGSSSMTTAAIHSKPFPSAASDRSLTLGFSSSVRWTGLQMMAGAFGLMGVSAFMASHIPSTPALQVDMFVFVALAMLMAVCMSIHGLGCLFGRVQASDWGLQVMRGFDNFSIPWYEITRWKMERRPLPRGLPVLHFWVFEQEHKRTFPAGWLCDRDLQSLADTVRRYVGEAE